VALGFFLQHGQRLMGLGHEDLVAGRWTGRPADTDLVRNGRFRMRLSDGRRNVLDNGRGGFVRA